jgi:H+-transporting ATPase
VLCADKTGTLTQNALTVTSVHPMPGFDEAHVLALAALASSEVGRIRWMARFAPPLLQRPVADAPKLIKFVPFDPAKKMSEASATDPSGATQQIVKGAFAVSSA